MVKREPRMPDAKEAYESMARIVNAPGYPLLRNYRSDFEKHDKEFIERVWSEDAKLLWIVRGNGTHTVPLGIHPGIAEEGFAALSMEGQKDVFTVCARRGVRRVSPEAAKDELRKFDWSADSNGGIFRKGRLVAIATRVDVSREDNRLRGDVALRPADKGMEFSLGDLIALRQISERLVISKAGTLFVGTRSATLDGADLFDLQDGKRARAPEKTPQAAPDEGAKTRGRRKRLEAGQQTISM